MVPVHFVTLLCLGAALAAQVARCEPVVATVYYESQCGDSRAFVLTQLLPAVLRGPQLLRPLLIPFGKANVTATADGYEFSCQHGESECLGNKLHACGLAVAGASSLQVTWVACLMSNFTDVAAAASTCAEELGLPYSAISACALGRTGAELVRAYGSITGELESPLSFVPTVTLNGLKRNQTAVLNDFWEQVNEVALETGMAAGR